MDRLLNLIPISKKNFLLSEENGGLTLWKLQFKEFSQKCKKSGLEKSMQKLPRDAINKARKIFGEICKNCTQIVLQQQLLFFFSICRGAREFASVKARLLPYRVRLFLESFSRRFCSTLCIPCLRFWNTPQNRSLWI